MLKKIISRILEGKNIIEIAAELNIPLEEIKNKLGKLVPDDSEIYTVFIDGASKSNPGPASAGIYISGQGKEYKFGKDLGVMTNNEAEYSAFLIAMARLKKLGAAKVKVYSDSKLLVNQLTGNFKVKQPHLRKLFLKAIKYIPEFEYFSIEHIERKYNKIADALANDYIKLDN